MKTLIIASLFLSLGVQAESFVVEMKRPLTKNEIKVAHKNGLQVEIFYPGKSAYLKRTYSIEAKNKKVIESLLPVSLIEDVHEGFMTSIETPKSPKFIRPDEFFHYQWALYNQGQAVKKTIGTTTIITVKGKPGIDIRWADSIAKIEAGLKKDPLVAVVDMGIDYNHPELKNRIFKNLKECDENGNIADSDQDKDGNQFAGDCMGWNFTARNMYEARRPFDDNGHGTHVSGIIAAETNALGISGVSSKIKILPIRVTGTIDSTDDKKTIPTPLTNRIARGIYYALDMGADVINLSLGWTRSMDTKYLREAMDAAMKSGVIIVAAAGNNNNNATIYPCSYHEVICVGAVGIDGAITNFSNYGGEVDVMAPGDEIISTIPLNGIPFQLNLQGYDIRSGTSQAAPYVSAVAALIRGTFPRLHRDEVTRRIVDSADASELGKSLSGLINLKGAFEIVAASSVRPIFKKFPVAIYDSSTKKVEQNFNVKNFGFEARDVVIHLKSASPSLKLEQEFKFPAIRAGGVVGLKLSGEVLNDFASNKVQMDVTITSSDTALKTYRHEFKLARDILKDPSIKTMPFAFVGADIPVGTVVENTVRNRINTVELAHSEISNPEYYISRVVKEDLSIEIKFFRQENETFKEAQKPIILPKALQLLNVTKVDMNYDGEEDYLIRAVACDKKCETPEESSRYIQYTVWDKDLNPLFGENSHWRFLPSLVNVDLKSQRFYKLNHKTLGPIAVPIFVENSFIPKDQQELPNAFSLPDLSSGRRVYFLSPEITEKGVVNLATKTLTTSSAIKAIKTKFDLASSDEVQAMHLLTQSKEEHKLGVVHALYSVGRGYLRQNILVTIKDGIELESFLIKQNLWGYEHLSSMSLTDFESHDSFAGLVSNSRLVMLQTNVNKAASYDAKQSMENPLSTIASFNNGKEDYTFFQTPSYLMMTHQNEQGMVNYQVKINRFSFLPGTVFNDTFYPVITKTEQGFLPALYVDETDIQNDIVSMTVFDGEELKTPIRMSAYVPAVCKAMNPMRLKVESGHSLSMLCLENKQWVMKFVEMN